MMSTFRLSLLALRADKAAADAPTVTTNTGEFDFRLYRYDVSLFAAIIAVVVFTILTILHIWRIQRHRSFYFTAFTLGGLFQVIGYSGRIWSHYDPNTIGGFVIQAILILVAPALYAASIYMILGRIIIAVHAENLSIIPLRWMTKLFVIGDVASFLLQAGGGGIQAAGTLELYDIGEKIIIVGLFVQIFMFGLFLVTTVIFHIRMVHGRTSAWQSRQEEIQTTTRVPWKRHLTVLYAASTLIMVRSIFRVIEYLQGNKGYLISHEIFLYVFDAFLMALVMAIFIVWYVNCLDVGGIARKGKYGSGMEMLSSRDSNGFELQRQPGEG